MQAMSKYYGWRFFDIYLSFFETNYTAVTAREEDSEKSSSETSSEIDERFSY